MRGSFRRLAAEQGERPVDLEGVLAQVLGGAERVEAGLV